MSDSTATSGSTLTSTTVSGTATTSSTSGTNEEAEAPEVLRALESELACLPGGRDRTGRPLILVNVPPSAVHPDTGARIEALLRYFLGIFSEDTLRDGLVVLVDARRSAWRTARACSRRAIRAIRAIRSVQGEGNRFGLLVLVVRPEGFWEKRVDSCAKPKDEEFETIHLPLSKLINHVEDSELPKSLGGSLNYDHATWIQDRLRVEEFTRRATKFLAEMTDLAERLDRRSRSPRSEARVDLGGSTTSEEELTSAARGILFTGRNLLENVQGATARDVLDTARRVGQLLESIEAKQVEVKRAWKALEVSLDAAKKMSDLEEGVARVTNWILGPADCMLNSRYQVGFDVASSEELRREHEELELECRETYGRYAELLHRIDSIPDEESSMDLKSQRDFMDFVCRSFACRLERRRNVLITCQRFFRLVSEYFDRTSEVFDKLVMGNRLQDFSQAAEKLLNLEKSQSTLEGIERKLVKEGEKLSDILSMPVKDALGRDVNVDYGEDIANIRDILDATNARKNIFNDSVELQKLTLKRVALIHTYEVEAEQAVQWLSDLFEVLVGKHVEVGCNVEEIQLQKEEHQSFRETARSTYDYGRQLSRAARVLRISCKLEVGSNEGFSSKLWRVWRELRLVSQEHLTRLRVSAVFHRSVDDHCERLRELIDAVAEPQRPAAILENEAGTTSGAPGASSRDVLVDREKLLLEVGRTVRLGRLLRSRLKEPIYRKEMSSRDVATPLDGNLSAVESISAQLAEVTRLAEKLDATLRLAGARTRPSEEVFSGLDSQDQESRPGKISRRRRRYRENSDSSATPNGYSLHSKGCDDGESTTDGYATAPECSSDTRINTPTDMPIDTVFDAPLDTTLDTIGSGSFFTTSECEEALWWKDQEESAKPSFGPGETVKILHVSRPSSGGAEAAPKENMLSKSAELLEKRVEERSGLVAREVTETTTLRVSHNTHLGVASFSLVSHTLQTNGQRTDVEDFRDIRRGLASSLDLEEPVNVAE